VTATKLHKEGQQRLDDCLSFLKCYAHFGYKRSYIESMVLQALRLPRVTGAITVVRDSKNENT
jgi:hypothetical protein